MTSKPLIAQASRLKTFLLLATLTIGANSQNQARLVLNVIIDGLRIENLDDLRAHLGPDGFNRLLNNGVIIENLDFGTNLDKVASTAMIVTGAAPEVNGIASATTYNLEALRPVPVFDDGKTLGNYTDQTFAPSAMGVTTFTDEIRIAGAGVTYSHAIAPDPMQALALGSHTANSAIWLNNKNGNWATSTFYKEFPTPAITANRGASLKSRLDTMQWKPSDVTQSAALLPDHLTRYPFRHTFTRPLAESIFLYTQSPMVNNDVSRMAIEYLNNLALGTHDGTDVLSLAFTLQPYPGTKNPESRYEQIDQYVKLNNNLAQILGHINKTIGLDKTIVLITGTPHATSRRTDSEKWNLPTGQFSTRRALSLLNMFLMAKYGNSQWVKGFHNNQFYIDLKEAEAKNIPIETLRRQAAAFLSRMAGVHRVITLDDLINGTDDTDNATALRRNTDMRTAGDLFIEILPGWQLVDDLNNPAISSANPSAKALTTAPALILAPNTKPLRISVAIDARSIAPTITRLLHIRSPNGCSTPPLNLTN